MSGNKRGEPDALTASTVTTTITAHTDRRVAEWELAVTQRGHLASRSVLLICPCSEIATFSFLLLDDRDAGVLEDARRAAGGTVPKKYLLS